MEQLPLTKSQLEESNIIEHVAELYAQTPNEYLKYRLKVILEKWRGIIYVKPKWQKMHRSTSNSVFEAIIMHDDQFFHTKSLPELIHRLLKSFDENYKVSEISFGRIWTLRLKVQRLLFQFENLLK